MSQHKQLLELITEMEGTAKYYLRLVDEFKKNFSLLRKRQTQFLKSQNLNHKRNSSWKMFVPSLRPKPKMATRMRCVLSSINMELNHYLL